MGLTRVVAAEGMTLRELVGRSGKSSTVLALDEGGAEVVAERKRKEAVSERDDLMPLVQTALHYDRELNITLPSWLGQTVTAERLSDTLRTLAEAATVILG